MPENVDWKLAGWAVAGVVVLVLGFQTVGRGGGGAGDGVRIATQPAAGAAPGRRTAGVYVHVAGEVRRPGLYEVPPGSRAAVALDRAGGPTRRAEMTAVNLAAKVQDGQQIVVPRAGAAPAAAPAPAPAGTGPAAAGAAPGAPVSLATATADQLDAVDGIGPTLAQRIVAERTRRGGFRSVDDLRNVDGIGDKRLARLKTALRP